MHPNNLMVDPSVAWRLKMDVLSASARFVHAFHQVPDSQFVFNRKTSLLGNPVDTLTMRTPVQEGKHEGKVKVQEIKRDMGRGFWDGGRALFRPGRSQGRQEPEPFIDFLNVAFFNFEPKLTVWPKDVAESAGVVSPRVPVTPPPNRTMQTYGALEVDVRNRPVKLYYEA